MASETGFITNKPPYSNNDLNTIFAPKNNFDYGTLIYSYNSVPSTTTWYNVYNNNSAEPAAYTKLSRNNVVDIYSDSTRTAFKFDTFGIYKLELCVQLTTANLVTSTYTQTTHHSFNTYSNGGTSGNIIPLNYITLVSGGNGAINNNANAIETIQDSNGIDILTTASTTNLPYPIIQMTARVIGSTSTIYYNIYTISMTFIVDKMEPYYIFPALRFSNVLNASSGKKIEYTGNWMVTKLAELEPIVGSLLNNGNSNASGTMAAVLNTNTPYTIEFYVYLTTTPSTSYQNLFGIGEGTGALVVRFTSDQRISLIVYNATGGISSGVINLNTWYHVAIVCVDSSENFIIYINGTSSASGEISNLLFNSSTAYIGTTLNEPSNFGFTGNMSNVRVTRKVVYTGNFTPPPMPLQLTQAPSTNIAAITEGECISLLKCYNTGFLLDAATGNSFTNGGSPGLTYSTFI